MLKLKVTTIASSVGLILPTECLSHLKVQEGDWLYLIEDEDGFWLTAVDPEFRQTMDAARRVMTRRRNALRELAK